MQAFLLISLLSLTCIQAWEVSISTGPGYFGQKNKRNARYEEPQDLEPCGPCDRSKCVEPEFCPGGIVRDRCDCCSVCGLEQSQLCNMEDEIASLQRGGLNRIWRGRCGHGLECRRRTDVDLELVGAQSICYCTSPEMVCGSDEKTYSVCQFEAEQAVRRDLFKVSSGLCKTKPQVEMDVHNHPIKQNENVTLICQAFGFPNAVVSWFRSKARDGGKTEPMPGDSPDITVSVRGGVQMAHVTSYLQITNFKVEYEGTYICSAENALGTSSAKQVLVLQY